MKSFLLSALLLATALSGSASAEVTPSGRASLEVIQASIDAEIGAAEAEMTALQDGPLKSLKATRIETLKLNRAIIQSYILGPEVSQPVSIPSVMPDLEMAAKIQSEIDAIDLQIEETERQIAKTTGAVVALPIVKLETDRLTRSLLQGALMRAKYGMVSPVLGELPSNTLPPGPVTAGLNAESSPPGAAETPPIPEAPAGANDAKPFVDPHHPEVDYSSPVFKQALSEGLKLSGWWILEPTNDSYLMLNASKVHDTSSVSRDPRLMAVCGDIDFVSIQTGKVLELGGLDKVEITTSTDWTKLVDGWDVSRGADGDSFVLPSIWSVLALRDSDRVSYSFKDASGQHQVFAFEVSGMKEALDEAFADGPCYMRAEMYSKEDIAFFQEKLNEDGYKAGRVDGSFGAGTEEALRRFQHDKGLPSTGIFDYQTIIAFGLFDRKEDIPFWKTIFKN